MGSNLATPKSLLELNMSVNGENGPHPESLQKLLGQLKGMAHEARRSVRRRKNRVFAGSAPIKIPRQVCQICGVAWDFTNQPHPEPPAKSRCGDCKNMLVSGYTALITATNHAWIKPGASGLKAGQVYAITDEEMEVIQKRFKEQKSNGQDATSET